MKDDRTIWQKIVMGIYNPSSHEFLGRSAKSWGKVHVRLIVTVTRTPQSVPGPCAPVGLAREGGASSFSRQDNIILHPLPVFTLKIDPVLGITSETKGRGGTPSRVGLFRTGTLSPYPGYSYRSYLPDVLIIIVVNQFFRV